jgi:hypothetical protein
MAIRRCEGQGSEQEKVDGGTGKKAAEHFSGNDVQI